MPAPFTISNFPARLLLCSRMALTKGSLLINDNCRHGAQNVGDTASNATLENEFGTSNEDECVTKILEGGTIQSSEVSRFPQLQDVAQQDILG